MIFERMTKRVFVINNMKLFDRKRKLPLSVVLQYEKTNHISIPLYNSSFEDIIIEQGDNVAEIEIWKNDVEVHEAQFYSDEEENVTSNLQISLFLPKIHF